MHGTSDRLSLLHKGIHFSKGDIIGVQNRVSRYFLYVYRYTPVLAINGDNYPGQVWEMSY